MLNALRIDCKASTRKAHPVPADRNQTLNKLERNIPKQGAARFSAPAPPGFLMFSSGLVSVWFLCGRTRCSFRVKTLRFMFKAFDIRLVYTCAIHVPVMFHCPIFIYTIYIYIYYIHSFFYVYIYI